MSHKSVVQHHTLLDVTHDLVFAQDVRTGKISEPHSGYRIDLNISDVAFLETTDNIFLVVRLLGGQKLKRVFQIGSGL